MSIKIVLGVCLVALLAVALSQAQLPPGPVKANILFPFIAEGRTLPAGQYEFILGSDETAIQILGPKKGSSVLVPIKTRLDGTLHTTPKNADVVFDDVRGTYTLSELWIPGADGFVLHITKEKHEHKTVKS